MGAGGVRLVQGWLTLAIKAHHQGGYAKRPHASALRVLLLNVGDPPGQVIHLQVETCPVSAVLPANILASLQLCGHHGAEARAPVLSTQTTDATPSYTLK